MFIQVSFAQSNDASLTSKAQSSSHHLIQILEKCDWRLLKIQTEPSEPNQLLPLALFRNHGTFVDLFRLESVPSLKIDFKEHRLFFSAQYFSQARLNPKIKKQTFTYALCEFPKQHLQTFSPKTLNHDMTALLARGNTLKPYFLLSSHPFNAYLNGQLIDHTDPHNKASFGIELSQLQQSLIKPLQNPKNQLLLRFYPLDSKIIWGLSTNPNQISLLKHNLDFHQRIGHEAEAKTIHSKDHISDKKRPKYKQDQYFITKKKKPNYRRLEHAISELETLHSTPSEKAMSSDQVNWQLQTWSIVETESNLDQTQSIPNYEVQSIQDFYLPYSMLDGDLNHLDERLVRLKKYLEFGVFPNPICKNVVHVFDCIT